MSSLIQAPGIDSRGRSNASTDPAIDPTKPTGGLRLIGPSVATGAPCRVTVYSTAVSRTWSMSSRHLALNSAAPTDDRSRRLDMAIIIWSFYTNRACPESTASRSGGTLRRTFGSAAASAAGGGPLG